MFSVAIKMLAGNPFKVMGIILGMTLSTALIAQQGGLFYGLMNRAQSTIAAARDVDIWVMHPATDQFNLARPISIADVSRLRGVAGVAWSAPLLKANVAAAGPGGRTRSALLLGLDDRTLAARPVQFVLGQPADLMRADAIAVDRYGYGKMWPGEPLKTGKVLTINERRAVVVAVTDAAAAFSAELIVHTRASLAAEYTFSRRHDAAYALIGVRPGADTSVVARRIGDLTGLRALTRDEFSAATIAYYRKNTGIVVNFATTIILGVIVAVAIVGLTFSLFVLDNISDYATLKMLGFSNRRLALLVFGQVGFLAVIGFVFGIGLAAGFFELVASPTSALRGFYLPWRIVAATFALMAVAVAVASSVAIWRVVLIEPDAVFRGQTT